jgi:hypothetical protein
MTEEGRRKLEDGRWKMEDFFKNLKLETFNF